MTDERERIEREAFAGAAIMSDMVGIYRSEHFVRLAFMERVANSSEAHLRTAVALGIADAERLAQGILDAIRDAENGDADDAER